MANYGMITAKSVTSHVQRGFGRIGANPFEEMKAARTTDRLIDAEIVTKYPQGEPSLSIIEHPWNRLIPTMEEQSII